MKIKGSLSSFDLFDLCVTFKRVKLSSNRPKMFKTYLTYVLCRNFSFYTSCNSLGVFALRGDPTIYMKINLVCPKRIFDDVAKVQNRNKDKLECSRYKDQRE